MIAPSSYGPRAARPALLPPTWPPFDPETGEFDLSDEAGPPDGFFVDPDVAMRIAEATAIAEGLSPADAWRDSNRKRSELTRAQWDLDARRRAYEEAQAFSFEDPAENDEPVFAELSPENAAKLDAFNAKTGLEVDFPLAHGGYFASVRDPVEGREIGVFPRGLVFALTDDVSDLDMTELEASAPGPAPEQEQEESWLSRHLGDRQLREFVLDVMPIIGNIRSAEDAYESWRDAYKAAMRGDWDAFIAHGGMGALSTAGAIAGPFSAPIVRVLKAGIRRLARKTPGFGAALARRDIGKAADAAGKSMKPVHVDKVFKRAFRELTDDQKKTVRGIFSNIVGTVAERRAVDQFKRLGEKVIRQGEATTTTVNMGGRTVTRRYDARIEELNSDFFVRGAKEFDPDVRSVGLEVKGQSSSFAKQASVDAAVEKDGTFVQKVVRLRYSLKDLSEREVVQATRRMLRKHVTDEPGGLSTRDVDRLVSGVKSMYRSKGDWVTAELFVGTVARAAAHLIAANEEEHRWKSGERWRRDADYHGAAIDQLMTGA